jgi:hypothetical protein
MSDVQVKCINKVPRENRHEGITYLGGDWGKTARPEFIAWLEAGNTAYISAGGVREHVLVVHGPNGKYVRAHRNNTPTDNLLALPECP